MDSKLYHGDCLEIMETLEEASVDAVITDPPYNSGLDYGTWNDNMPMDEYWNFIRSVVLECERCSNNIVVIKHSAQKIFDWCHEIKKSRMVVWYKPFSSGFPINGFAMHYEPLWITQGKTKHWSKDVIIANSGAGNKEKSTGHPAQMPELLSRKLVEICTNPGDTVLDPFMGSGTTGVACAQTGRNFIGIEIDDAYFKIAEKRINKARQQLIMELW